MWKTQVFLPVPSAVSWMQIQVLCQNFSAAKEKVMGFFVGQIMKEKHGGKANPASVREALLAEVEKEKIRIQEDNRDGYCGILTDYLEITRQLSFFYNWKKGACI